MPTKGLTNKEGTVEVEISLHAGFCFGVKRAVRIATDTKRRAEASDGGSIIPVYTYGPLVHNPAVIDRLSSLGIISVEDLTTVPKGYIVIRSHGVPPEMKLMAARLGFSIIDATCPLVRKIHEVVRTLRDEGCRVIIIGRHDHPEVVSIMGHAGDDCLVIESVQEAKAFKFRRKTGVVVQTTAPLEQFREISAALLSRTFECRIHNTICFETLKRQQETRDLAARVDAMVVVGGRSSSNTTRLVDICNDTGTATYRVEKPEELEPSWFSAVKRVGVAAGASTPEEVIERVRDRLLLL